MSSHRQVNRFIKKPNLNRFDSLYESDDEQMNIKLCDLEKRTKALETQLASLTEALKTAIDFQMAAVNFGPQVSPSQSGHVATPPVAPAMAPIPLAVHSASKDMSSEQPAAEMFKLVDNHLQIEMNSKLCQPMNDDDIFFNNYDDYLKKINDENKKVVEQSSTFHSTKYNINAEQLCLSVTNTSNSMMRQKISKRNVCDH